MKSIHLTIVNLSRALKALALLGLIATLSAPVIQAQSQSDQQPSNRLITYPAIVKALPSQNKRWALLIGVDRYEDSNIGPLKGAANDANSLKGALVSYAGFPQDQVIVLTTNEPPERQPTRRNILKRLAILSGLVPKDGLLLVSFAGHGIERSDQAFLIPSDATLTEDIGLLEETAVAVAQVKRRIKDTGVQQVMILLDACRAYPTGRSDSSNPLTPAFVNAFSFENRNREVDAFVVLYATAPGFRAYEYAEKHQGYFSWAIAQALKGA
ncbi:MAG TPA: caspase family protein, partial [Pyrinomonadaceae bacterium]|nr:caspase family protein [Pyrinomonadaceae bacterium]